MGNYFCVTSVSKTNLKPKNDIEKVKEHIKNQLEIEFDYGKDIILLDDNSGDSFTAVSY